jgi:hypothetical protein
MIPLEFITREPEEVKRFIYAELEALSPFMKPIISALHDVNWKISDTDDVLAPEVIFSIQFQKAYRRPTRTRLFEVLLSVISEDQFDLQIGESGRLIADTKLNVSDWGPN